MEGAMNNMAQERSPARVNPTEATDQGRLRIVLATIALNIVTVGLLTLAPWSNWRTGLGLKLLANLLLLTK